jgi:diguanylate cyclase (GGDEF)-like protein
MTGTRDNGPALEAELIALFETASLPTSPLVATRILELINDSNSTARCFARTIEADPALAGRLLKMANSARYAQRTPATTIQRAVTVVGLRQLRVVALGFELVNHLDRVCNTSFDLPSFWQRSVLRACLAREIALRVVPSLAQEAFLIGLLQDAGIPLLAEILGGEYADAYRELKGSPTAFGLAERKRFRFNHVQAISALASLWGLPPGITRPLSRHHDRPELGAKASDEDRLDGVSYLVGAVGFDEGTTASADPMLPRYARTSLGLSDEDLGACLAAAREAFDEMAELFDSGVIRSQDASRLLQMANRRLMEQAQESESRVHDIEVERDQILDQQETLRNALGQYREQAARDPLTGLLNRRALLDATVECLGHPAAGPRAVTVLFLDLDDFKQINDDHGHLTGDDVLRGLSNTLRANIGETGFAGRYGGEEFIMVLPGLNEEQSRRRAERLLESVRSIRVDGVPPSRTITCSIGAVWCHLSRAMTAESLFGTADELMYIAKRGGKNRVTFRALKAAEGFEDEIVGDTESAGSAQGDTGPIHVIAPAQIEAFREVAAELEREGRLNHDGSRKQQRPPIFTPCIIGCFNTATLQMVREEAYIRNVSVGGVGVLLGHPLVRGDVVEVALTIDDQTMHLAGLVSFCRHIDGSIHEVGVQVVQSSPEPIIIGNQEDAIRGLGWVAEALGRRWSDQEPKRKSA